MSINLHTLPITNVLFFSESGIRVLRYSFLCAFVFLVSWEPRGNAKLLFCFVLQCQVLKEARSFLLHIFLGWEVLTACLSPSKESKSLNPFFMLPEKGELYYFRFMFPEE